MEGLSAKVTVAWACDSTSTGAARSEGGGVGGGFERLEDPVRRSKASGVLYSLLVARPLDVQLATGTLEAWWARSALLRGLGVPSLSAWEGSGRRSAGERHAAVAMALAYLERGGRL